MKIEYTVPETLQQTLAELEALKTEWQSLKGSRSNLWPTVQDKLLIDWTHHSNAIEGSTLTRGETGFFLQHGLTVEGKPFKDFLDARNHADAIEYLYDVIKQQRPITENLIREFNALLLDGVKHTKAINQLGEAVKKPAHPGHYKEQPNHVLQPDGTIHYYVEPHDVPQQMGDLLNWVNDNLNKEHPVIVAALAHYHFVRIHPFDDGNGRGARLLMNMILIQQGYPPAVIKIEQRRKYIEALGLADQGDLTPFVTFILEASKQTIELMVNELKSQKAE